MYSEIKCGLIQGIEARLVTIEADVSCGLPIFDMVGFLSSEVKEAKDRVRTSLRNTGFVLPAKRITINIAPASIRKTGTGFDLPMAIAILAAMGEIDSLCLDGVLFVGELALSGALLPVNGILPIILMAKEAGFEKIIIPMDNLNEGLLVPDITTIGFSHLSNVINFIQNGELENNPINEVVIDTTEEIVDFANINGQFQMRRACEIAVSGMHNLLMLGPPGAGKTLMAKCIPTILPDLTLDEKLELSKIYSVCGLYQDMNALIDKRPFRSPHHSISPIGLVGGGRVIKPGEISLAHNGVLFLDELPEFNRSTIEILRQPMEDGQVTISRASGTFTYPSNFMLVAAMNPCLCGYYPDMDKCRCAKVDINRYLSKLSQPLLDRIDICVEAKTVTFQDLFIDSNNESSETIKARVVKAHNIQQKRYSQEQFNFNSQIPASKLDEYCPLGPTEKAFMESMYEQKGLTARTFHKLLRVARTIADMNGEDNINKNHLAEALMFRGLEKKYWENLI